MATLQPQGAALSPMTEAEAAVLSLASRLDRTPATAQIGEARSSLKNAITVNEAGLHEIATRHANVLSQQLRRNAQLSKNSNEAQHEVGKLASDFDVTSLQNVTEVESLRMVTSGLQTSAEATAIAHTTASAIGNIQQQYTLLTRVEDGVWSGKSADAAIIADLIQLDDSAKRDTAGAAVQIALASRCSVLRTMVSEQLSNAWIQAVSVTSGAEGLPIIAVQQTILLSPPKGPRSTFNAEKAGSPPTFALGDLCNSLDALGNLHGILSDLYSRIIRNVVEPFLEHPTWRPVKQAGDKELSLVTTVVPPQAPLDVIENVKTVLQFVRDTLPPPCHSLGSRLQAGAFNLVLDRILVPGMPPSLSSLPEWLHTARAAAEWEASLGSHDPSTMVVAHFMNSKAGQVWLNKRRIVLLRQARRIAYDDWSTWTSKQVDLGVVQPPVQQPASDTTANDDDEDGWGFDDDPRQLSTGTGTGTAISSPPGGEDDENDGWAFDDVEPRPALAAPSTAKPREAKRLGKRTTHKASREESFTSSTPLVDDQASTLDPETSRGQPVAQGPVLSAQYRTSLAADNVLQFVQSTLNEMAKVSSLNLAEASFNDVSHGLSAQLAEGLDLIRASIPVAQMKSIDSSPINMVQLANDYRYLSYRLASIAKDVEWQHRADVTHRFATASAIALENFVVTQTSVVTGLLDRTRGFSESFNPNTYAETDEAVQQTVALLHGLASELAVYVDANVYHNVIGKLVETTVTSVLHNVLSLEDITEIESQRIGSTLARVEGLGQLFQPDPALVSTAAAFVPHWIKFGYLIKILQANLLEITYLFDNGSLIDFTSEELGRLIRALFADSPQRATLLDKIEM